MPSLQPLLPPVVLHSPADEDFDGLTKLAVRVVGATAGLISLVDEEGDLTALAQTVLGAGECLLVEDAGAHPVLGVHETLRRLEVRGFAGIPLVDGDRALGALCVLDVEPRSWTQDEEELLVEIASAIVTRLGLRNAAALARESAEELQAVLASSLDCIIVMDDAGIVSDWNPAAESTFGWTRDEAIGRRLGDMIVPEELRQRHEEGLARAARSGESRIIGQRLRLPALRKDGSTFTAELAITKLERGGRATFTGTLRDLTEIVDAEQATAAAESRYRSLIENIPVVAYVTSMEHDAESMYVSPQIEALLGYTLEEWSSNAELVLDVVHPEDRARAVELARRAREERTPLSSEFRLVRKDGGVISVVDHTIPMLDGKGELMYCQGFLLDITARKELEEQLRQSQKLEAIGQLAGGIAHDFNNMLTAISGYAELIGMTFDDDDPRREDVNELQRAAGHAAGLTRQLLAFSRKQILLPQRLDPNAVVRELEPILRRTIGQQIELRTDLMPELAEVEADLDQLAQVVLNIALNARDAMPDGGRLTIATHRVELESGPHVAISLADTGSGMDETTRERVFEPFFTTKEVGKGTGLGLSTAYGVVSQSGGSIEIASELGSGSTFRVLLPVAPVAARAA